MNLVGTARGRIGIGVRGIVVVSQIIVDVPRGLETDGSGICQFTGLDPNQKYNLAVNAAFDPSNCDCCPFRRVDPGRGSAIRNDVELIDGGDGWRGETNSVRGEPVEP